MTTSITDPAGVVNLALARIGFKGRIGSLYEGSATAKKALDIYAQTRDQLLRQYDWGFAARTVDLVLLKQAPVGGYIPPNIWTPAYPALPWNFSYTYPSDALKVRAVKPAPIFIPSFDPQPHNFSVDNDDTFTPSRKVILTNVPDAVLVYTAQITDPDAWECNFSEALAAALGRRLAPVLVGMDAAKMEAADEVSTTRDANAEQG